MDLGGVTDLDETARIPPPDSAVGIGAGTSETDRLGCDLDQRTFEPDPHPQHLGQDNTVATGPGTTVLVLLGDSSWSAAACRRRVLWSVVCVGVGCCGQLRVSASGVPGWNIAPSGKVILNVDAISSNISVNSSARGTFGVPYARIAVKGDPSSSW